MAIEEAFHSYFLKCDFRHNSALHRSRLECDSNSGKISRGRLPAVGNMASFPTRQHLVPCTSAPEREQADLQVKLSMNLGVSEILANVREENLHLLWPPTEDLRQEAERHSLQSVFERH